MTAILLSMPVLQFGDSYSGFRDPYLSLDGDSGFGLIIAAIFLIILFYIVRIFTRDYDQAAVGCFVIVVMLVFGTCVWSLVS